MSGNSGAIEAGRAFVASVKLIDQFASQAGVNLGLAGKVGNLGGGLQAALKAGNDAALSASLKELAAAKTTLSGLTAEAAAMREKSAFNAKLTTLDLPTPAVMGKLASSMAGSFSGFAAGLLGRSGGGTPEERTAKAAEKTVELLEEVRDAIEDAPGLAFGA